jgi:hypothetical protein
MPEPTTELILVPHTHWDREWYQPFDEFRDRLVHMMDALIATLDADPRFAHFHLDGQMAMVDDYLEVRPEREPDVRRLAAEGRISLGPWYTQMDEFLVSGESLVRNLETGLRRARELGRPLMIGYLPDQFGHVGQMPQILRMAGIERAVVWRGVPAAIGRTTFRWEAPDGTPVLAEYLPFGYSLGWYMNHAKDPKDLAQQLDNAARLVGPMSSRRRILVTVGGDHQLAQTKLPPLLEEARGEDGVTARMGSLEEFLAGPDPTEVPVWRGELRSAARAHLLPNVVSNRVHQKRERARVEALVERYAEPLAALVPGFEWPAEALDRIWKLLLWNGAHDSVCGCSVDQVARDVEARYVEARTLARDIVDRALASLASHIEMPGTLRFNPSPFEREGVPGLGWSIDGQPELPEPVELRLAGTTIVAGGARLRLVDEADVGDLYTFCPDPTSPPVDPARIELRQNEFVARFDDELMVTARVWGWATNGFVEIKGEVSNDRPDHRLRLHVELAELADSTTAVSPFELVSRPLVGEGRDLEWPSPTWPARGAVLAGGIALLQEGVFEYEVARARELAVTLLRAVGTISRQQLASRPASAGPDIATPGGQMIGRTELRIGVVMDASPQDLLPLWERFALPLLHARSANSDRSLPGSGTLLPLELGGAALSSIRRVAGTNQVRVWNPTPAPLDIRVGPMAAGLRPSAIGMIDLPPTG